MRNVSWSHRWQIWENREDRRANIELFQLCMHLPAAQKFDPPVVWYAGTSTGTP